MCLLFETIRLEEGKAHFVAYHQKRIDRSVGSGISLAPYIDRLELPLHSCFKLRITYKREGIVGHEITPYTLPQIHTVRLITDNTICYDRKLNDRTAIDRLRNQRGNCDDILIVRNGLITDSSFANVVLFDGNRWVTPAEPLLAGTCMTRLIDMGVIVPKHIPVESLPEYSKLTLINAMIGFDPNRHVVPQY